MWQKEGGGSQPEDVATKETQFRLIVFFCSVIIIIIIIIIIMSFTANIDNET